MKEGKDSKVTPGATSHPGPLPHPLLPCRFGPPLPGHLLDPSQWFLAAQSVGW